MNVNNNCSTGSSALYLARQAIRGGTSKCALAVGFEKMERGSLKSHWDDRINPMDKHMMTMVNEAGSYDPRAPGLCANRFFVFLMMHFKKRSRSNLWQRRCAIFVRLNDGIFLIAIANIAGREHMKLYNTKPETFAKIAEKNHYHSQFNPYSQFKTVYSLDQILASPKVFDPLTKRKRKRKTNLVSDVLFLSSMLPHF